MLVSWALTDEGSDTVTCGENSAPTREGAPTTKRERPVGPGIYRRTMDTREIETVIMQKEEDLKQWCRSSGENVGKMNPSSGDDWWIECPTCGRKWAGGSTVLADHNRC